jgi:Zn-finger nucleic acid-binding protein
MNQRQCVTCKEEITDEAFIAWPPPPQGVPAELLCPQCADVFLTSWLDKEIRDEDMKGYTLSCPLCGYFALKVEAAEAEFCPRCEKRKRGEVLMIVKEAELNQAQIDKLAKPEAGVER